jgi:hypothetical protein
MGYSKNPSTVTRRLSLLRPLLRGEPRVSWTTSSQEASLQAYRIREALYIIRLFPDLFPELIRAARSYKLRVIGGTILAESGIFSSTFVEVQAPQQEITTTALSNNDIIQAWIDHYPRSTPLRFDISDAEINMAELKMWLGSLQPAWFMIKTDDTQRDIIQLRPR